MTLFLIAFVMFAAGAAGGVLFAVLRLANVHYPRWFGAGHGLLGLTAVCVLGYAVSQSVDGAPRTQATWALGVFIAGLLGGVTFFRLLPRPRRPMLLVLGHGALGLVGLYLLYGVAFPVLA